MQVRLFFFSEASPFAFEKPDPDPACPFRGTSNRQKPTVSCHLYALSQDRSHEPEENESKKKKKKKNIEKWKWKIRRNPKKKRDKSPRPLGRQENRLDGVKMRRKLSILRGNGRTRFGREMAAKPEQRTVQSKKERITFFHLLGTFRADKKNGFFSLGRREAEGSR
jgi:hypothetical protein